jgi:16S rRNA (guanine527-N7)-methyltransferase
MEGVLEWNEKVNLTAITEKDEFIEKHFIDSLLCAETLAFSASSSICDVGTGGGFPGIPLAICYPEKQFTLMDSLGKRLKIVRHLCDEIGINNVQVVHGRAEELARNKDYREQFDLCVSRAVANMRVLSEYCLPFVKPGGCFIAYKGPDCREEIEEARRAIEILGGDKPDIRHLAHLDHSLVVIQKKAATPDSYPRKAGTPAKKPL